MRITERITQNGKAFEELEIEVPASADRDVKITIRTADPVEKPTEYNGGVTLDEKTLSVPRPVWDNLVAALATQKAKTR